MVTIDELEKGLKTNNLASIYLLFGEELFLLESNLKKIKKQFGDCIKGINYILLDEDNVEEIISDIQTPAFGYEKKLIIARDTGILKKEGKKKTATGRVVYIHPRGRYCTLEFEVGVREPVKLRESFQLVEGEIFQ